jgi:hypothetical protein
LEAGAEAAKEVGKEVSNDQAQGTMEVATYIETELLQSPQEK